MKFSNYIPQALLISCVVFSVQSGHSQAKDYLDCIVTKDNDTIYGTFKEGLIGVYLLEYYASGSAISQKYIKHTLKGVKSYRYNDFFSSAEAKDDGAYGWNADSGQSSDHAKDYVVTAAGDTIRTNVYEQSFSAPYYKKEDGAKQKIKGPDFIAYKKGKFTYEFKSKPQIYNFDKKEDFLLLMLKSDAINLYGYRDNIGVCYYLEKDGAMHLIYDKNYKDQCKLLFGDNAKLMELLDNNIYSYENMYLVVKYYVSNASVKF
jgi:hypothetical protein